MRLIEPDPPHLIVALIYDSDAVVSLEELHIVQQVHRLRHTGRPARIIRRINVLQADFRFRILPDDIAGPGLQDGIVPIAGPDVFGIRTFHVQPLYRLAAALIGRTEPQIADAGEGAGQVRCSGGRGR